MLKSKKGFLLFEVVLSVLIIGAGIVIVGRGFSLSVKGMDIALELTRVTLLAESKMCEFEMLVDGVQTGSQNGTFKEAEGVTWYLVSEPQEENKNLSLIRLTANWAKGSSSRKVFLNTYLKGKSGL